MGQIPNMAMFGIESKALMGTSAIDDLNESLLY